MWMIKDRRCARTSPKCAQARPQLLATGCSLQQQSAGMQQLPHVLHCKSDALRCQTKMSLLTRVWLCCLQDHEHLGSRGDIVEVKAGHARQTLFPKGEADYAVPSVLRQLQVRDSNSTVVAARAAAGVTRAHCCCFCSPCDGNLVCSPCQIAAAVMILSSTSSACIDHAGTFVPQLSHMCFMSLSATGAGAAECAGAAGPIWHQVQGCQLSHRPLTAATGAAAAPRHQGSQQQTTGEDLRWTFGGDAWVWDEGGDGGGVEGAQGGGGGGDG